MNSNNQAEKVTRFDNAAKFIQCLFSSLNDAELLEIKMPRVTYLRGGKINFHWQEYNGFIVDMDFHGNGPRSYYAKLPNGEEFSEELGNGEDLLPEDIINQIIRYDYQWK